MPFEALVSRILTKVLGDYIEGLAAENLDISILSGSVVQENLHLKKTAFDALALPVVVKTGFLGKLTLNVPWKNLSSQPTTVTLDRLYVLLSPTPRAQYDPKSDERKILNMKLRRLELAELVRGKEEHDKQAKKDEKPSLASVILSNMQIDVNTLHIRYEDDVSHTNSVVIGVTLEHLRVITTNESWQPAFLSVPKIAYKLIDFQNLSVYCNSASPFLSYSSTKDLEAQLESLIPTASKPVASHHYIVSPISGRIKATLCLVDGVYTLPKIALQLEFPDLQISIEENQYRDLLELMEASVHYVLGMEYRKFSPPFARPTANVKAWWAFAFRAVKSDVAQDRERWHWKSIKSYKQDRVMYMALWKARKKLSEEQKKNLEVLEARLPYEALVTFRHLAHALKKLEKAGKLTWQEKLSKERAKDTAVGAFFSKIFDEKKSNISALTQADWRLLYDAIQFGDEPLSGSAVPSALPKDYVKTRVNMVVVKGTITLSGSQFDPVSKSIITVASFGGLRMVLDLKDGKKTNLITTGSLAKLEVVDHYSFFGKQISVLSAPFELRRLLEWSVEANPPSPRDEDIIVRLMLEPVELVLARPMIERVVDFITLPLAKPKVNSKTQQPPQEEELLLTHSCFKILLSPQLEKPMQIDLRIDIEAPTIILPEDFERDDAPSLVLPVHLISICTDYSLAKPPAVPKVMRNPAPELVESYFYRRLSIKVTKLQAFVAPRGDDWKRMLAEESLPVIVDQQTVSLLLSLRVEPSLRMPLMRLTGDLPSISLSISDRELSTLLRVIDEVTEAPPRNLPYLTVPPSKSPVNEFIVEVALKGADVQFALYEASPRRDLISAGGSDIALNFQLWEHYTAIKITAGALRAVDQLVSEDSPFAKLVATGPLPFGVDAAVTLRYTGVSRVSPCFAGVDHEIALAFPVSCKVFLNPRVLFASADLVLAAVDSTDERKAKQMARLPKDSPLLREGLFTLMKVSLHASEVRELLSP